MDKEQIKAISESIPMEQRFSVEQIVSAAIESYKAELLKEVGEPVAMTNQAQLGYVTDGMHPDIPLAMWAKETSYSGANIALYTSDQVAAAIIKATKPLEDQLAKAEQRVAEACKSMCLRLVRKENEHAAGYGPGYLNYSAQDVADLIDNGEWRKFVKEV